ncbi:MAG: CehA/McbA family metallohydrolase [Bradymonadia bacterium]
MRTQLISALLLGLLPGLCATGCTEEKDPVATARRIESRAELVGGPSALGEIGDYMLENEHLKIIIQDKGFSRGFGVYGGSLIDADIKRGDALGTPNGGRGLDSFGEMFPAFFVEALAPTDVRVTNDGSDGSPPTIVVSGTGGDFLSLTKALNRALTNSHTLESPLDLLDPAALDAAEPQLGFTMEYSLLNGTRAVQLKSSMVNITEEDLEIPPDVAATLLRAVLGVSPDGLQIPVGFVILYGGGNHVFAPGYGYDVRFSLEESYAAEGVSALQFPALPGLIVPGLISTNREGNSYGFFAVAQEGVQSFPESRLTEDGRNAYEVAYGRPVGREDMLIPFLASSFTGVFYAMAPNLLKAGESFSYQHLFVVGDGDVSSVMDEVYRIRGTTTGTLQGRVRDVYTAESVEGASVLIYDAEGRPFSQMFSRQDGAFRGNLPPGDYTARVELDPVLSDPVPFTITANQKRYLELGRPEVTRIRVAVRDEAGRPLPAKVTVVGTVPAERSGQLYRKFLFDLAAGQRWRSSDFIPDDPADPKTRRYIETVAFTDQGRVVVDVPPGQDYEVYVSRGMEYDLHVETITAEPNDSVAVQALLKRVVDTTGYVGADFHLHAAPSLDSDLPLTDRIRSVVGEGLEYLVATDHNFVTDYREALALTNLTEWASSMIGLEMTTLESGHFNGFPLRFDIGAITKGSFEWSFRTPEMIFGDLRNLGSDGPENTVVQVNHARDLILGYFSQYGLDPLTGRIPAPMEGPPDFANIINPSGPSFFDADGVNQYSGDFDALEVLNGGLPVQIHHERMPDSIEGLSFPETTDLDVLRAVPPGAVLCEDGEVAFPGVVDDWFNFLNMGLRYAATANSDSHHAEDAGYPRTFVRIGRDDPFSIDPVEIAQAVKANRMTLTNGPFVELFVNGAPIGEEIATADGAVTIQVKVQAAPWVQVSEGVLYVNGEVAERFEITIQDGVFEWQTERTLGADSWVVVEVTGDESLFPVVRAIDIPPVLLNEAFASIAGPLGLGGSDLGDLEPLRTAFFSALALTNPIWIDVGGDGWTPPGVPPRACDPMGYGVMEVEPEQAGTGLRPRRSIDAFGNTALDVHRIFEQFSGHAH